MTNVWSTYCIIGRHVVNFPSFKAGSMASPTGERGLRSDWHRQPSSNKPAGLHQTKELLPITGNSQQNEKASYRLGEIFANCISDKGLISKI